MILFLFKPTQEVQVNKEEMRAKLAAMGPMSGKELRTFIHADKDYRCTLANGLEMFAALKLHGVESKLCMFYGENHGLSREGKPSNRISRLSEILRWMDEHLKEE